MEDQVLFNIESNLEEGFFSIYAGLRMLLDHESQWQIEKNKDQPKEKQVFSLIGAEAYCRIQELKESHPEMVASAELRYVSIYKKE
ncbi:hypothetical protein [Dyadobacter sp. LHD-138]|uniref:hypothetical protein n=1 Tax=Dyadobacter sp. LHD-138 TaxID=3071413 RepID=UPI0027E04B66|nr:hypothetical protein [Dyadobacter sp. LHD-138]MDQ6481603.1 hypothetical protein [Dyadobacter sp. LHD-138]